jgi:hypothetical protein
MASEESMYLFVLHRSFAPPPQQANRGLVGAPGFAQDDTREVCFIRLGILGWEVETKATTPLKPTAGFHPSEPSLAGDPGLNGTPGHNGLWIRVAMRPVLVRASPIASELAGAEREY